MANSRPGKPKDEEKQSTEESCSQPVPKHPRTGANVQQAQYELKLGEVIVTIPEIDFDEEIVGTQVIQTAQKQQFRKSRRPSRSHRSEIVNLVTHSLSLKQMYDEIA